MRLRKMVVGLFSGVILSGMLIVGMKTKANDCIPAMFDDIVMQQNEENMILNEVKAYKRPETIGGLTVHYREEFNVSDEEKNILYRIVEAEAGGEDYTGRLLVANVILNRCENNNFPDSVEAVVFAPSQFSPISDGRYYGVKVSKTTKKAVNEALEGTDISDGAVYFMCRRLAASKNVSWFDNELNYLFRYGCHEFFKD